MRSVVAPRLYLTLPLWAMASTGAESVGMEALTLAAEGLTATMQTSSATTGGWQSGRDRS